MDPDQTTADQIADQAASQSAPDGGAAHSLAEQTDNFFSAATALYVRLLHPWTAYQALIVLALIIGSYAVYYLSRPAIRHWLGRLRGRPKWQLRFMVLINQRLWLLIFIILSWLTVWLMRELTWPSRSHFVEMAAILATGYFLISISTRMIRNKYSRKFVNWVGWIYITLKVLGLRQGFSDTLDLISIQIGSTTISALDMLTAFLTLGVLFVLSRIATRIAITQINNIDDVSPSVQVLLIKAWQVTLFLVATLIGLYVVGFDVANLAILSGAVGLGIGFGLQKIISNLVSGAFILMDESIKPGDVISLEGTFGWITELGARFVSVTTRDGREHLIPNEDFITTKVINWSHSNNLVRLDIFFRTSFECEPRFVKRIASEAPLLVKRVEQKPAPVCHMINVGENSLEFILRFWIHDTTKGLTNVKGDVYLALWDALKDNNIDIPYPRRDVQLLNPTPSTGQFPTD